MCVPVQEPVEHSDVENIDMSLRSNVACDASLSEKQDLSLTYRKEVYNNDMTDNKVLRKLWRCQESIMVFYNVNPYLWQYNYI